MPAFNIVMTPNSTPKILVHSQPVRNLENQPVIAVFMNLGMLKIQKHLRLCNLPEFLEKGVHQNWTPAASSVHVCVCLRTASICLISLFPVPVQLIVTLLDGCHSFVCYAMLLNQGTDKKYLHTKLQGIAIVGSVPLVFLMCTGTIYI